MVQTTLRLPDRLYVVLKAEARKRGMSMNAYLIGVLWSNLAGKLEKEVM